jgi:hypothetical protein
MTYFLLMNNLASARRPTDMEVAQLTRIVLMLAPYPTKQANTLVLITTDRLN